MSHTHDAVAHAWAHKQPDRRGYAMFSVGATIYSWGEHFPIARHTTFPDGTPVVLVTDRTATVSTAKHKSIVNRAILHLMTLTVDDVMSNDWDAHLAHALAKADALMERARRARSNETSILAATAALATARTIYRRALGKDSDDLITTVRWPDFNDVRARIFANRRSSGAGTPRNKAENHAALRGWLHGKRNTCPRTAIPWVRVKGNKLETSWGASVRADAAVIIWRKAEQCRATRTGSMAGSLDPYGSISISPLGTIRVGCHTIPYHAARIAARIAGIS